MSDIDVLQAIRIVDIPLYIGHDAQASEEVNGDKEEKVFFHRGGANVTRNLNRDLADYWIYGSGLEDNTAIITNYISISR